MKVLAKIKIVVSESRAAEAAMWSEEMTLGELLYFALVSGAEKPAPPAEKSAWPAVARVSLSMS